MHAESMQQMTHILDAWQPAGLVSLLDVGSFDVNGTYRPMVERRGWQYTGLDVTAGPNVDIVSPDPYRFPIDDNTFDVVVSGSTMEHVQAIWLWVPELVRVLKPGGLLAIITHTSFMYHRFPVDCWRVMPDGMVYLFDLTVQLEQYEISMYCQSDISGVARKRL
jgi:SAM-dependent methyltransferase